MRWWRVFVNKVTGQWDTQTLGPRRRTVPRFAYQAPLTARCSSWPKFVALFSGEVSSGGLFVPTDAKAAVGELVELDLTLPDGSTMRVRGAVVAVIDAEAAARMGRAPGIGIKIDPLEGVDKVRFEQIVDAARASAPMAAETTETGEPEAVPLAPLAPVAAVAVAPEPETPPVPVAIVRAARPAQGPIVGIDLGTSYSSVAAVRGTKVSILARQGGSKSQPSVIAFPTPHGYILGEAARTRLGVDPSHTVSSPKRLLGRRAGDRDIQAYLAQCAYKTLTGPDGTVAVEMWGEQYAITQLCSYLLADARDLAEKVLGESVRRAVVTVPVSFDEDRVKLLKRAGKMVGLDVIATIDEPSAAALANRFVKGFGGIVGVYDFGGGTFDFSVIDVGQGDFKVLGTAGDSWLGGDDFDLALAEALANRIYHTHKVDVRNQQVEWQMLLHACEQAKRRLSTEDMTTISITGLLRTAQGMIDVNSRIDRASLERVCAPVIARSIATCREALDLLEMKPSDLSAIFLSGGTTHVPAIRTTLEREFGIPIRSGVPVEHAVCLGAGIHAAQLQLQQRTTLD